MRHYVLILVALAGALASTRSAAQQPAGAAEPGAPPPPAAQPPPTAPAAPPPASPGAGQAPGAVAAPTPTPAAQPTPRSAAPNDEEFSDRFVLETGRIDFEPPQKDRASFRIHGEDQIRFRALKTLRLEPPPTDTSATTLGQNDYVYHWLRITPRFSYRDVATVVAQLDVLRGLVFGDTTQYVDAARDPLNEQGAFSIQPRYLYLELKSPIGLFRIGQQSAYWGLGVVANDGDHPSFFGDYQRGQLGEKLFFATKPLGAQRPLVVALSGELVYEDNTANLVDDHDRAFQGVAAVLWEERRWNIGAYGVVRHQERDLNATGPLTPFTEELTAYVVDVAGKFQMPVPGANAFTYGAFEAAVQFGSTNFFRSVCEAPTKIGEATNDDTIRGFGGAATLGAVHVRGSGANRYGDVAVEFEWGYASGDANPCDGVVKRFTFDPNHNVGLVLFDHVLAWKTARAGTLAQNRLLVDRAAPGAQYLASNGGIFGATYLNPRLVVRPRHWLDLKAGAVIAQTTADFVDPYHFGALGNVTNYDGGDERGHDLGLELDWGIDVRVAFAHVATLQLGAEAGVLFPGRAFDDAAGTRLDNQSLINVKAGLQY